MNLVLFETGEVDRVLPSSDPRAIHIREVLKLKPGQSLDCGIVDGPRGKGTIESDSADGLSLRFEPGVNPPPLDPVWVLIGLPRPPSARRILFEATTMGAGRLLFFRPDRGVDSYAQSRLWRDGSVRHKLVAAAGQAFSTRLPEVRLSTSLRQALDETEGETSKIALDNYEATVALGEAGSMRPPVLIAIGSERGWSDAERGQLRDRGFVLAHLGPRVLRTETACVAALSLVKDRLGLIRHSGGTPPGCNYSGR